MRIVCSICLDEVGDSLLVFTNCGHVFDRDCAMACLNTSDKCPICRKYVYNSNFDLKQPFYRVYLSTDNDNKSSKSARECEELQEKLAAANMRLSILQSGLSNARHDINTVVQNFKSAMEASKAYKSKLDATLEELATLKTTNSNLQQQINAEEALIKDLKKSKKTLLRSQKALEESNDILKEQIVRKNALVFKQYYQLTNKSNCLSCKKLRSPHDNDDNVDEWKSTPKNLDNLSCSQLRAQCYNLQEKYDCLATVHCEMIKASSGLTESAHDKMYIRNLETQLKESKIRQVQLESLFGRTEMVQQLAKELISVKQKQLKLEADLEQMSEAKRALFDQKNQVEESLDRALEAILTLQNQKEESIKEISELQTRLTEATDAKLILQKQLKSSKKRARRLQIAKEKAQADSENIVNKMNLLAVQYFSFEKAFRDYIANRNNGNSDD
ncbi:uncharacterized protein ATC70_010522 [Mucor velutinosus]|uniref:RING-type domain-containing protein n=1 Tax=Mucor velutinosus TaxID=708070 RepID=A0AAN7I0W0_9FUNG|nr:hypothetical protein ATC70_010522 [Mucor velutinosus]